MKFVWCGGVPGEPRWWQLCWQCWRASFAQRRAERRLRAERDAAGIPYSLDWWP